MIIIGELFTINAGSFHGTSQEWELFTTGDNWFVKSERWGRERYDIETIISPNGIFRFTPELLANKITLVLSKKDKEYYLLYVQTFKK